MFNTASNQFNRRDRRWQCILAAAAAILMQASASACFIFDHAEPLTHVDLSSSIVRPLEYRTSAAIALTPIVIPTAPVNSWMLNTTGKTAQGGTPLIHAQVNGYQVNVQEVKYDANYAYVKYSDIPDYPLGPYLDNNYSYPSDQKRVAWIPRSPKEAATKTMTDKGPVGVLVDGAIIYNPWDARSYTSLLGKPYWKQNAVVWEASGFDVGPGHPVPLASKPLDGSLVAGQYHVHGAPFELLDELDHGNTGQHHSPIIGFGFDGFPIYGPYGYSDPNNDKSKIARMTSGYRIRDDLSNPLASRSALTEGGSLLSAALRGPSLKNKPAGSYLEDYEYEPDPGDLNEYNMCWTKTPEYPSGTWAYFVTLDSGGQPAYPYMMGPNYFGDQLANNLSGHTSAPSSGIDWTGGYVKQYSWEFLPVIAVPEPASLWLMVAPIFLLRRRPRSTRKFGIREI